MSWDPSTRFDGDGFRITADSASVIALTKRFVHGSADYHALAPEAQRIADDTLTSATDELSHIGATESIDGYKAGLRALAAGGWLTPTQVMVLAIFADVL